MNVIDFDSAWRRIWRNRGRYFRQRPRQRPQITIYLNEMAYRASEIIDLIEALDEQLGGGVPPAVG